jgi:hypothetical protein
MQQRFVERMIKETETLPPRPHQLSAASLLYTQDALRRIAGDGHMDSYASPAEGKHDFQGEHTILSVKNCLAAVGVGDG